MIELINSNELWKDAAEAFELEKQNIEHLVPGAVVEHTGATAVPNCLTKGDLDIQVSVAAAAFEPAKHKLTSGYSEHHPELWTPQLALFHKDKAYLPVGIALTVSGSGFDEFDKLRDLLQERENLLKQYNELKMSCVDMTDEEYRQAKANFFGPLGASYLLQRP